MGRWLHLTHEVIHQTRILYLCVFAGSCEGRGVGLVTKQWSKAGSGVNSLWSEDQRAAYQRGISSRSVNLCCSSRLKTCSWIFTAQVWNRLEMIWMPVQHSSWSRCFHYLIWFLLKSIFADLPKHDSCSRLSKFSLGGLSLSANMEMTWLDDLSLSVHDLWLAEANGLLLTNNFGFSTLKQWRWFQEPLPPTSRKMDRSLSGLGQSHV